MSTLEVTLTNPVHRGTHAAAGTAIDRESRSERKSFTLVQSIARVGFTLVFMVGFSALFATQIYATLR